MIEILHDPTDTILPYVQGLWHMKSCRIYIINSINPKPMSVCPSTLAGWLRWKSTAPEEEGQDTEAEDILGLKTSCRGWNILRDSKSPQLSNIPETISRISTWLNIWSLLADFWKRRVIEPNTIPTRTPPSQDKAQISCGSTRLVNGNRLATPTRGSL